MFGGTVTEKQVNLFKNSYVKCKIVPTQEYILANAYTDIVGYHLKALLLSIIIIVLTYGFFVFEGDK